MHSAPLPPRGKAGGPGPTLPLRTTSPPAVCSKKRLSFPSPIAPQAEILPSGQEAVRNGETEAVPVLLGT